MAIRVTGPLCGETTDHRRINRGSPQKCPVIRSFDDLLNFAWKIEQTTKTTVIWAAITLIWRQCNVYFLGKYCILYSKCAEIFSFASNYSNRSELETLDQDIDPLASVNYTDMKPLVNSYIQKLVQTKSGAAEEVPAPNQSLRGCNHPTSNWPYQGHQIPYLVPRTADWLSPLWSNTDHWPYAAGVCTVTGKSWWILHSRLVESSLPDNSWYLHSGIPARSGILLSDMM